jgi:hypothetical protein
MVTTVIFDTISSQNSPGDALTINYVYVVVRVPFEVGYC